MREAINTVDKRMIVVRKAEFKTPKASSAKEDKKLDLTGEFAVDQHIAYFFPNVIAAFDIEGILKHELLAIDSRREGNVIYSFNDGYWEKRLQFDDIDIMDYAVDAESNFYFLGRLLEVEIEVPKACIGCVDKAGNLVWCYACESDEITRFEDGQLLFEQNRVLLLLQTYEEEGELFVNTGARLRVISAAGEVLAVRNIVHGCDSMASKFFMAVNNERIEILHGGALTQFTLEGGYLGEKVFSDFDIIYIWRFDERIIVSVEWPRFDEQGHNVNIVEIFRESDEIKIIETPAVCNRGLIYYDGKYYSGGDNYYNEQGENVEELRIEWEPGQLIRRIDTINMLDRQPVKDDFGHLYLMPTVCYLPRRKVKLQRILLDANGKVLKDDVFICEEKGLLDIVEVLYHHGKIYVVSCWETNKKEKAIQAPNLNVLGEVIKDIPFEELDVHDLLKTSWSAKTVVTVISPK